MYSKKKMKPSIEDYYVMQDDIMKQLQQADAIIVGAGSGLSTAAGLHYDGERFQQYFEDFIQEYGFQDMYSAGFYPFETLEQYWAYWSRFIYVNRYDAGTCKLYRDLYSILHKKEYFVITSNVDHQFQINGFDKQRLFYMQGDYGLLQCSGPCHTKTYENESLIKNMVSTQKHLRILSKDIPLCPICHQPMIPNLRCDDRFVEDEGWYAAKQRYETFLKLHKQNRVVFLELGVGFQTPGIIKYPFWQMTAVRKDAVYIAINQEDVMCPNEIMDRSLLCKMPIETCVNAWMSSHLSKST